MKNIPNKYSLLWFFALFFSIQISAQSAKDGFFYGDKIPPRSTVYMMTNQKIIQTDSLLFGCGDVLPNSFPELWKATYYNIDSIVYQKLDSVEFLNLMAAVDGDWLMFVHGAGKTFERAAWRAFDIQFFQGVNVVAFSWPAVNVCEKPIKDLKESVNRVPISTRHLRESLLFMQEFKLKYLKKDTPFSLLLHSMGNMFLEQMVDSGELKGLMPELFDNLLINSAAVNEKDHKRWVEQLNMQKRIYITSNKGDVNLLGVRLSSKFGKQLGQKIKSPPAKNAFYINFSDAIGFELPPGVSHTYFIATKAQEHPEIAELYHQLFHGEAIQFDNKERFKKRKDGVGFDFILKKPE